MSRTSTSSARIQVHGMLYWSQQTILVQVLVDSGADDDFIDSSLVKLHDLALVELSAPKKVLAIDSCKHCGCVIERGQLRSDPVKVKAVEYRSVPSTRKQLQRFLGFANFWRQFVGNYSLIAAALTQLWSVKKTFEWSPAACQPLKDLDLQFVVNVDASDSGVGQIMCLSNLTPHNTVNNTTYTTTAGKGR